MKRLFVILSSVCIVILAGCGERAVPLEEVDLSKYEVYASFDDYTLFIHREIPDDMLYHKYALYIGPQGDTCIVGHYHETHFMVEYKEAYYSIREANKLGIYDCQELRESGFLGESPSSQGSS